MSTSAFSTPPANNKLQLDPFSVNVPQQDLDELEQLLRLSRLPPRTFENLATDGRFGVSLEWVQNMKAEWLDKTKFDWRAQEKHINSFPHFTCSTLPSFSAEQGQRLHFAALFSPNPAAIPIVLLHGWPGSFLEFLPILELVSKQHASDPQSLGYHLIVPSLPGYGFSSAFPAQSKDDFGCTEVAKAVHELMTGLGFDKYVAQGGDIGSKVARILGATYDACKVVHLNFSNVPAPPPGMKKDDSSFTDQEKADIKRADKFANDGAAYAFEQSTRPSTLGFVLSSNPIALLAWVGEKYQTWADPTRPLSSTTILEAISLYWFTNCISTALYPYREQPNRGHDNAAWALTSDKAAFGFSSFRYELLRLPRKWIETTGEIQQWTEHEVGGHFAALECPEQLWGDVEKFIKKVWVA